MTQTLGQWQGHMFDTQDMKPLAGEAMEKTLEWMEEQTKFGHADQFDKCLPLVRQAVNEGVCVLTFNHGNTFDTHLLEGSIFANKDSAAKLGVSRTPGSTHVLDRDTMKLVPCTHELCPYAEEYPDIGLVNYAPAMAFGGWTCAVNNFTSDRKKRLTMEFCSFLSSKEQTLMSNVYNATRGTDAVIGGSPFRTSLLDPQLYIDMGYESETTHLYMNAVDYSLNHPNPQTDIRFPTADQIDSALDKNVRAYLQQTTAGMIPQEERPAKRQQVIQKILSDWSDIMNDYDSTTTTRPILEAYQKLRGVYTVDQDYNYLNQVVVYGYVLMSLALLSSVFFGAWAIYNRDGYIARASQPFFLVMICTGAFIFGSSMFPMGVDDSSFSVRGCSIACMSIPWLLACGWTIIFSAIYAKLHRINTVMKHAKSFRRVVVKERDVLPPFGVMFTINLTILLAWTLVDPLTWTRIETSEISSYGTCTIDSDKPDFIWKIFVSILGIVNGVALVMANWAAYKARHLSTELGESKWIAMAMGSLLQLLLVAIPILFLVRDNPSAKYFVSTSIVFVITLSILGFIFVPKIIAHYEREKERESTVNSTRASNTGMNHRWSNNKTNSDSNPGNGLKVNLVVSCVCPVVHEHCCSDIMFISC